ncbi:MAG TPA: methyltransferase [Pyrinomonadaceae bacterium]|nr:methyltransferase [Pyrinomonadaceae bacterium]
MASINMETNQAAAAGLHTSAPETEDYMAPLRAAPRTAMTRMIYGFMLSQAIYVAAQLGLADLLKDGPRSSDELAGATCTDSTSLYRVLRALAAVGVFEETEQNVFALTPMGETLRTDAEGSLRPLAVCMGGQCNWQAWGDILHSIKTGESAFEHVFGTGFFQHLERHPDNAKMFLESMNCCASLYNEAIVTAYDFSRFGKIVDIGGGQGKLITAILKANQETRGVFFDTPNQTPVAQRLFQQQGVADRCETITGDFLEAVPEGGDAYLLKHIIHDWDDPKAVEILKNCRRSMSPEARLLLIEEIVAEDSEFAPAKVLDIQQLLMPGGRERTAEEYRKLLEAAGFELTNIIQTQSSLSIIESKPV